MYFFGLLCMLGLFSACSDDDKVEPIGTEFDGVYKGTLDVDLDGTKVGADLPQKVYVTKVGDNQIKMELKNFSFGAMALGNISVRTGRRTSGRCLPCPSSPFPTTRS